nr:MAG TPA: hypothetical protein [Caudoviricetes sp.]
MFPIYCRKLFENRHKISITACIQSNYKIGI